MLRDQCELTSNLTLAMLSWIPLLYARDYLIKIQDFHLMNSICFLSAKITLYDSKNSAYNEVEPSAINIVSWSRVYLVAIY